MGAFLGTPVTEKISENAENDELFCGGSSMQGWRSTQEDAHNCILNFDTKTSLFAVYDGHGGADVAIYSSEHLPDAIKKTESYAKGDYVQALKDAFLEFDATLITDSVVKELEKIAQKHNGEAEEEKENEDEDDEESVHDLYKEATMPLADVMARYKNPSLQGKLPSSPFLRAKKTDGDPGASSSSSSSLDAPGCSSTSVSNSDSEVSSSSGGASSSKKESKVEAAAASSSGSPSASAAPSCTSSSSKATSNSAPDSSSSNNIDSASSSSKKDSAEKVMVNGIGDSVSSSQNGGEGKKAEAKGSEVSGGSSDADSKSTKSNDDVISSSDGSESGKKAAKKRVTPMRVGSTKLYEKLLTAQGNGVDSSESDEDDETFEGNHTHSDDDDDDDDDDEEGMLDEGDDEEDLDDDSEDLEEEEGEEDSDELEDDDDDEGLCFPTKEKVGEDSGCTAVVALLRNDTLYVANAGDSRCVVSRNREAIEMSFDHKPEDPPEKTRIVNAGGKVTADGRVNGGLNLSRALGDHSYKQNKSIGPTEQMISALPDIKTLDIDRSKDEFMVLACDGIWNSMTSQEVIDFVGERLDKGVKKLTDICEDLFDACLAPNTIGDGTGCDNMTCIIVRWKKPGETNGLDSKSVKSETKAEAEDNQPTETTEASTVSSVSKTESEKRAASPDRDESSRKKSKLEGDPSD